MHIRPIILSLLIALGSVSVAQAGKKVRVAIEAARATALERVPGKLVSEELEKEDGRWIYSFVIKPTGETRRIVKEVNVDAGSGEVVAVETEKARR